MCFIRVSGIWQLNFDVPSQQNRVPSVIGSLDDGGVNEDGGLNGDRVRRERW